jgi:hypothetical protein
MRLVLVALLAAVGLSGCYASKRPLLDARQAVFPMAEGVFSYPQQPNSMFDISREPEGSYRIYAVGDDETTSLLFTPLSGQENLMVVAMWEKPKDGYVYGLAYVGDDRLIHFGGVSCDSPDGRRAAVAAGARATSNLMVNICSFRSRSSLMAALSDYARTWNRREAEGLFPAAEGPDRPR